MHKNILFNRLYQFFVLGAVQRNSETIKKKSSSKDCSLPYCTDIYLMHFSLRNLLEVIWRGGIFFFGNTLLLVFLIVLF